MTLRHTICLTPMQQIFITDLPRPDLGKNEIKLWLAHESSCSFSNKPCRKYDFKLRERTFDGSYANRQVQVFSSLCRLLCDCEILILQTNGRVSF